MFVGGATITVTSNGGTWTLDQVCSDLLDSATIILAAEATGLSPQLLASADICIYTAFDLTHVGVVGTHLPVGHQRGRKNADCGNHHPQPRSVGFRVV
jgi:hypothetical protein